MWPNPQETVIFTEEILKVGLSPSKKYLFYLLWWKLFKHDEKCFLFHLKSSARSQDIKFLPWLFAHVEKKVWLEI